MPHELTELRLDAVTRPASGSVHEITTDVCVVGAGIAGCSAAIESARLGRSVVLVDSLPLIGGQMVHSLIGLFCGVFGNAPEYTQLTHGLFDDIFASLAPSGELYFSRGHTTTVFYNEVALGRWLERTVRDLGIQVVTGAVLGDVALRDGFVTGADFATRYGHVRVRAAGYVDASGDAVLTWRAGLPCWVPSRPIYGSQQVIVENLDEAHKPESGEIDALFAARGEEFGLLRRGGLAFFFPGRGTAVLNVTHIDAPLDPLDAARAMFEGARPGGRGDRAAQDRVPEGLRRGTGAGLRLPGQAADPLDTRRPPAHRGRSALGDRLRRRGGTDGVAGGTARPQRRLRVGDVSVAFR
jgi:flavin-dependent dehydrogenase